MTIHVTTLLNLFIRIFYPAISIFGFEFVINGVDRLRLRIEEINDRIDTS